jgi:hypothetical protein
MAQEMQLTEQQVNAIFKKLKEEQQVISSKIGELELEQNEHK